MTEVSASPSAGDLPPDQEDIIVADLPDYVPLHQSLVREFEKTSVIPSTPSKLIDDNIKTLMKNVKDYIDYVIDHDHLLDSENYQAFLSSQLSILEDLLKKKFELDILKNSIDSSKKEVYLRSNQEPDLSIDSLDYYQQSSNLQVGDLLQKEYEETKQQHLVSNSFQNILNSSNQYKFLRNTSLILKDPETSLPDTSSNDLEDLEVAGGKIALKDPISLNYFRDPVKSRKCNHVYEREHIVKSLESKRHCPIDGCEASISPNDLVPDELMQLRVKVYLARAKHKKPQSSFDRI
ncbi:hypothetical protein HYPBUDRAFT_9575 [Hyphopichia burtonii NRRL Y-1933]|uniref:SP-RING-type domain-containing protein n=1 Tax=Hyphopichia burtonii NRRL Y-1933 TaxID=984485 RepID=A0A1E4RSQ6_9ASCO|nr:hypothetical protein HYPBUDRAFT_9575 [Hyphopichia burtonii NRRL Y-1933]ODV70302.1 hypothetical protein HYPBUDRAFT_9575 [Hyphopichia burtonii NRRL Y-1933]